MVVTGPLPWAGAAAVADRTCGVLAAASALTPGAGDCAAVAVDEIAGEGAAGGIALTAVREDTGATLCDAGGDDPAVFDGGGAGGESWHAMP